MEREWFQSPGWVVVMVVLCGIFAYWDRLIGFWRGLLLVVIVGLLLRSLRIMLRRNTRFLRKPQS